MNLQDIILNASTGGVLGLLGGLATGVLNFFQTKQANAHQLLMKKEEREMATLIGNIRQAEFAADFAKLREQGAADAFTESQRAGNRGRSHWLVDALRDSTRPLLTWFFTFLTTWLIVATGMGWLVMENVTDPLLQYSAVACVNTTMMMHAWWFGQRQIDKVSISWGNRTVGASVHANPGKP